ncbi:antirestriction protein ArdA [Glycomyces tenuis]|uniref:antirestriction protein ArdA n=1 Tax=Glycomyces tenuis TaxID=58116 RepID=UPI0004112D79|nr:antirestriction protein ArdA [Glycomyces tenuis]
MTDLRAWVGCWACYSEGRLVGDWFDLTEAVPTVEQVHRRGLDPADHSIDVAEHEELGAFDLDGDLALFTDTIGESLATAARVTQVIGGIEADHLAPFAAFAASDTAPVDAALVEQFKAAYVGAFESVRDFGIDHCMELTGWDSLPEGVRQSLGDYIDWAQVGQGYLDADYDSTWIGQALHVWHLQ